MIHLWMHTYKSKFIRLFFQTIYLLFSHPDYTVGHGIAPYPDLNKCQVLRKTLADFTADREFHPAPKNFSIKLSSYILIPYA